MSQFPVPWKHPQMWGCASNASATTEYRCMVTLICLVFQSIRRCHHIFRSVAFISEATYTNRDDNCGDQGGASKKEEPTPPALFWYCTVFACEIWSKEKQNVVLRKAKQSCASAKLSFEGLVRVDQVVKLSLFLSHLISLGFFFFFRLEG